MLTSGHCFSVSLLCSEPYPSLRKILPVCHYIANEISKCLFRRAVCSHAGGANLKIQASVTPGDMALAQTLTSVKAEGRPAAAAWQQMLLSS